MKTESGKQEFNVYEIKKNKFLICGIMGIFVLFCFFIIYSFSTHKLIIMGRYSKIYQTNITELDLRKNQLTPKEEYKLNYFTNLKYLNLRVNEIDSVDFVKYMPDLERLEFMGTKFSFGLWTTDDYIKQQTSHTSDSVPANDALIDYTPLGTLKKLKILCISGNKNEDISFLEELPSLEYFEIDGCDLNEEMINCISSLNNLKSLSLCNASFRSTNFFMELKKLKEITLYNCNIENTDVSDFMTMPELEKISVLGIHIEEIEKFAQIKKLKVVRIGNEKYDESELKPLYNKGIEITN